MTYSMLNSIYFFLKKINFFLVNHKNYKIDEA